MLSANAIARMRCEKLLQRSIEKIDEAPQLSRRYVELARKIAARHRISLGHKSFCRKCDTVFVAGKTLKVRVSSREKMMLYVCLKCGNVTKFGYGKKQKADGNLI